MRKRYPLGLLFAFFVSANLLSAQSDIYVSADKMPFFPGCEHLADSTSEKKICSDEKLIHFISENLLYPRKAKDTGLEGTVLVSFIIDTLGYIREPGVMRDIGGGCGEEALRVIRQMPAWEAGVTDGKKVAVKLNLPINFALQKDEEVANNFKISWGGLKGEEVTRKQLLENLFTTIYVRDEFGEVLFIDELFFTYTKKRQKRSASSRGSMNDRLARVVQKARPGGTFTLTASVQSGGKFLYVDRSFLVVSGK